VLVVPDYHGIRGCSKRNWRFQLCRYERNGKTFMPMDANFNVRLTSTRGRYGWIRL
jgi:hypothetical protein